MKFYFIRINNYYLSFLRKIIYFIDSIFLLILNIFIKNKSNDLNKNVIVFIKTDALGDFLLWLGTADKLSDSLNGFNLVLICNDSYSSLAKDLNYFSKVIPVNIKNLKRNFFYRYNFFTSLRRVYFHSVINPIKSRDFLIDDSIIRFLNSDFKIGSVGDLCNSDIKEKIISDNWYTKLIKFDDKIIHELQYNNDFINKVLCVSYKLSLGNISEYIKQKFGKLIPKNYIIISPGSSWNGKSWPTESFIDLINLILIKLDVDIILTGTDSDILLCEKIRNISSVRIKNMAGTTTLNDLIKLVGEAKLVIGNDSAVVHLAAILKIQSVCILGGGHFGRFHPYPENFSPSLPVPVYFKLDCYGCNWHCVIEDSFINAKPCISMISVSNVFSCINQLLGLK